MKVHERFLNYVKFDTTSDEESFTTPSTPGQIELAKYLVEELKDIGLSNVELDEYGYVYATLPANINKQVPVVGFIAHMDTSPAVSGKNIKPRVIKYEGEDIILNEELDVILSSKDFPSLNNYIGEELIVTDGTTLLGADDKAGIAEIITALEYIVKNNIKHGTIKVAFTPDEEIGRGADKFDVAKFAADFAYTMDGGPIGELQYENFNAAGVKISIQGRSVHPGSAKGQMINAVLIATEIAQAFPKDEVPEKTGGYEGFYHLTGLTGSEEEATMSYIIRDFDKDNFERRKQKVLEIVESINKRYSQPIVEALIYDQYYNMKEKFTDAMYIIDLAKEAMEEIGVTPNIVPIRGGTDGARLSYGTFNSKSFCGRT